MSDGKTCSKNVFVFAFVFVFQWWFWQEVVTAAGKSGLLFDQTGAVSW